MIKSRKIFWAVAGLALITVIAGIILESIPSRFSYKDQFTSTVAASAEGVLPAVLATSLAPKPVTHIATPHIVRGVYMTACIAASPTLRKNFMENIANTVVNALIVDIKDYTGTLAFSGTKVLSPKGNGCRVRDLPAFIAELHEKGIYAIARVTVFQDPLYASTHPEMAIQSESRPGLPWQDKNGLAFIDPDFPEYWDYIIAIAKEAYDIGFDEVNFDYIRFPSDGDMNDANFAIPEGSSRALVMEDFFAYLSSELAGTGVVTSADIFGQTVTNRDDMGIGQIYEKVLPYFDFVSPMVYPSHFTKGFMGFENPASEPYQILRSTMISAVERAIAVEISPAKIRPWLQAFDLGADYTPEMIRQETKGINDAGVDSWLLWDAGNSYDREALR